METTSRSPTTSELSGTVVRPPLTLNEAFAGTRSLSSSGRPSPRARRDALPSLDSPSHIDKLATSLRTAALLRGTGSFRSHRKESRGLTLLANRWKSSFFSGRRLLPWLVLIGLWSYIGFHMQTKWAGWQESEASMGRSEKRLSTLSMTDYATGHLSRLGMNKSDVEEKKSLRGRKDRLQLRFWLRDWLPLHKQKAGRVTAQNDAQENRSRDEWGAGGAGSTEVNGNLPEAGGGHQIEVDNSTKTPPTIAKGTLELFKEPGVGNYGDKTVGMPVEPSTKVNNGSLGRLVGPFDEIESQVLGHAITNRRKICSSSREGFFADFVNGKRVVVIFHELSMTGAPLAMLELATEMVNCGGKISAVILNKKGGLYKELLHRGILILQDKAAHSWKAAAKADLVVASSAACNVWIGQYLHYHKKGGGKLVWWVMENRREYFDRSKLLLGKARSLVFLSSSQEQLWRQWALEEAVTLPSMIETVGLSVNDDLAATAGLDSKRESDVPTGKGELDILEVGRKRQDLRNQVRKAMGLDSSDFLVISLSSINPGKGQLLMLQAALMVAEGIEDEGLNGLLRVESESLSEAGGSGKALRKLLEIHRSIIRLFGRLNTDNEVAEKEKSSMDNVKEEGPDVFEEPNTQEFREKTIRRRICAAERRSLLQEDSRKSGSTRTLKILLGSVGSKSNRPAYLEKIHGLLGRHPRLADMLLWTQGTVRVAPLYAAADAYVMNAQGIGETFGRVTIEAMAFGLPVLGTDTGGTKEIVDANVTGLCHPTGNAGIPVLARHLRWLLSHPELSVEMGEMGKQRVRKLYRQGPMYEGLARLFIDCVREPGG